MAPRRQARKIVLRAGRWRVCAGCKEPDGEIAEFLRDPEAMSKLDATLRVDQITDRYDAMFVAGGHGVMWDLATASTSTRPSGSPLPCATASS